MFSLGHKRSFILQQKEISHMNIKVIFSRLKLKEQKDKKEPFKKILIKLLIKQKKLKIQPNK